MGGLVALPLIAHLAIEREGWRAGWLAVGVAVLLIGIGVFAFFAVLMRLV